MFRRIFPWVISVSGLIFLVFLANAVRFADPGFLKDLITPTMSTDNAMRSLVSLVVLGSALYIILSKSYTDAAQKWAFGIVGTLLGFYLKP